MKFWTKETRVLAVIAAIVTLLMFFLVIRDWRLKRSDMNHAQSNALHPSDTVTKYWLDKLNTEHAAVVALGGRLEAIKLTEAKELDEATVRLQIKDRQIEALQKVVARVSGKFKTKVETHVIHDTTFLTFSYKDSNITETAVIKGDEATVDYDVNVPIYLTQYWKRGWILGRKTKYVDGYSTNPNAHITNLRSIRIEGKEPGRFGVGAFIGVGFLNGINPNVGFSLHYSLIRF